MECSEINVLGCIEQYRETESTSNFADQKVQCVVQSLGLHPTSSHAYPNSLKNRVRLELNSKIPSMTLFDTDVMGAKVSGIFTLSTDLGDKDSGYTIKTNITVYDDKGNSAGFNASQEFTKDGLGRLDISSEFDYDDKRVEPETRYED